MPDDYKLRIKAWDHWKSLAQEGESGPWKVAKFEVSEEDAKFANLRAAISFSDRGRTIEPGTYTRLTRNGAVIMSDTPAEQHDFRNAWWEATGHVLVSGLGLGCVAQVIAYTPGVLSLTVVEKSQDVINLVKPHLDIPEGLDFRIIKEDVFAYNPIERRAMLLIQKFDFAWHDIWDDLCADNRAEVSKLQRRYGRWVKKQRNWMENCRS